MDFFPAICVLNINMSSHYYNEELYPLQDKVLQLMGQTNSSFYLTEGTLLSRFMLKHRYSDDLDLFVNNSLNFSESVSNTMHDVLLEFENSKQVLTQDSFIRYMVSRGSTSLKLEFVNDVGYRVGKPEPSSYGINFDTWLNVLSNKIIALSRDAAKDVIDILFLALNYSFNWEQVFDEAKKKDAWINEINASKILHDFNISRLSEVSFPESFDTSLIKDDFFMTLAKESLHGFDNSLYGKKL